MVILLSIQCETDKNEDCPALELEKSKPVEPWWGGMGPGAVSYGSRRRDWAHADNAPPSPWPNLWRVARRGPGARRLVVEIRGASSQRPRDFSHGPQRSAGGRRRPTKRLLSNVTFSQLFVPKGRPRPEG